LTNCKTNKHPGEPLFTELKKPCLTQSMTTAFTGDHNC
jgi:hypothetical protein